MRGILGAVHHAVPTGAALRLLDDIRGPRGGPQRPRIQRCWVGGKAGIESSIEMRQLCLCSPKRRLHCGQRDHHQAEVGVQGGGQVRPHVLQLPLHVTPRHGCLPHYGGCLRHIW